MKSCEEYGHKFEARYDELGLSKVYVQDVCVNCGKIIKRIDMDMLPNEVPDEHGNMIKKPVEIG